MAPTNRQPQVNKGRNHHVAIKDSCEAAKRKLAHPHFTNYALHKINLKPKGKLKALQNRLNIENTFGVSLTEKQSIVFVL